MVLFASLLITGLLLTGPPNPTQAVSGSFAGARWTPPLGFPPQVLAAYRAPPHRYAAGHRGIDLGPSVDPGAAAAPDPRPVFAPEHGTVAFVGTVVDRPVLTLRIDARTLVSLEPVASGLHVGDEVTRGSLAGTVASGGHCAARCVHLGVRVDGEYANPAPYLLERPVLLPLNDP